LLYRRGLVCGPILIQEVDMENGATGVNAAAGGAGTGQGSGNAQLQQAFQQAIQEASATLAISVSGQAQLNALRARPN
jgi:hypothetical protein